MGGFNEGCIGGCDDGDEDCDCIADGTMLGCCAPGRIMGRLYGPGELPDELELESLGRNGSQAGRTVPRLELLLELAPLGFALGGR
jgi:hypothetical protein